MKRFFVSLFLGLIFGTTFSLSVKDSWAFDSSDLIIRISAWALCIFSFGVGFFLFYIFWPDNQRKQINSG